MPTNKPRVTFAISPEELTALEDYQYANRIKSQSKAILALIEKGLLQCKEEIKSAPPYTEEALKLAKDYDDLDGHGKKVVRLVADEEKARCAAPAPVEQPAAEKVIYIFPGYTSPMSAGTGQPAGDEYPENYRLVKEPPRRASFIAPVSGDSMEPTYNNGDLVFVRAQEEVEPGEIGVFWMDGQQWIKELGEGVLISHNPDPKYGPRPFTEDIRCQGLVLCVCDESYFE